MYLSDLPEVDAFAHGGLKKDANYSGKGPVSFGGKSFPKSILIHVEAAEGGGRSHATYALAGGLARATRFKATIGLDDEAGKAGTCTFAVEVLRDGKWERVFESGVLRGGEPPQDVDVDLSGASQLRLVCTDAGDNINSDHATWAGARVQ